MVISSFSKRKAVKVGAAAVCVLGLAAGLSIGGLGSHSANAAAPIRKPASTSSVDSQKWSFGIIGDTQWTVSDDGYNPNTVAANIIKQVDQRFKQAGVKLVVAVGDTIDVSSKTAIDTRALYAQDLYNAGIGFYPLRGNHEVSTAGYTDSGPEFQYLFPQIGTGVNNATPSAVLNNTSTLIPAADLANNPPAKKTGKTFTVGSSFSFPTSVNTDPANKSLSYSFRYNNATFMLLDQFDASGNSNDSTIAQQQPWITSVLSSRPANTQAFVFSHKMLLGGEHKDNLFGANIVPANTAAGQDPGDGSGMDTTKLSTSELTALQAKQTTENNFLASLQANNVPFVISGHDHHDYESVVTSPDGKSQVHELITQSDSSKFYTPSAPFSANDAPVQEDLNRIGYYIVTVDGPLVTIDYYGDTTGGYDYGLDGGTFTFRKMSSMSYSLNGKEDLVTQGGSYAMTDNTTKAATMEAGYTGTTMAILGGTDGSIQTTNYGTKIRNDVNTGWQPAQAGLSSDILTLSGMSETLGSAKTDEYVLSMSYVPNAMTSAFLKSGKFGLLTRDAKGEWVTAVSENAGISRNFVLGPWNSTYKLGTYGVDPATKTAWAVINYNGKFAVGLVK